MEQKIQKWGRLEQRQQTQNYDLGGVLQGIGGIASVVPLPGAKLVGAGLNLIGGLFNNSNQKKEDEKQRLQQELIQKQDTLSAMPKSGAGLANGSFGSLSMGGYITPELLAFGGYNIDNSYLTTRNITRPSNPNMNRVNLAGGGYTIPPDGGDGKTVQKTDNDDEKYMDFVAKKMASSKELALLGNDPAFQKKLRAEYEALKPKGKVGNPNAKGVPLGNMNSKVSDNNWYSNSAALSNYKMLKDAGRMEEANQVVFGHYGGSKYGGKYTKGTHGEAESQGLVTPIRYNDLQNLNTNPKFKGNLPKDYDALIEGTGLMNSKRNGIQLAKGGFINPLTDQYNGLVNYGSGGLHEQNPLGGIPLGKNIKGKQNSVEQGETSFKFKEGKYIFSNRLKLGK